MNLATYIGLPYLPKGRDRAGLDCWGLCVLFYHDVLKIEIPSYVEDYTHSEDKESVAQAVTANVGSWREVEAPEYGDVLVFNVLGLPIHTAVYIGDGDFLHAFQNTQSCIERLESITWARRLSGIYRWARN